MSNLTAFGDGQLPDVANLKQHAAEVASTAHTAGGVEFFKFNAITGEFSMGRDNIEPDPEGVWAISIAHCAEGYIDWDNKDASGRPAKVTYPFGKRPPVHELEAGNWQEVAVLAMVCVDGGDKDIRAQFELSGHSKLDAWKTLNAAFMAAPGDVSVAFVTFGTDGTFKGQGGSDIYRLGMTIQRWDTLEALEAPGEVEETPSKPKSTRRRRAAK